MTKEAVAIIAAMIGGILTGIFTWLSSRARSSADERIQFQANILQRLKSLEEKTTHLEEEVTIWKIRYWSLYARTLKKYQLQPPDFHKMDLQELEKTYNEVLQSINSKSQTNDS